MTSKGEKRVVVACVVVLASGGVGCGSGGQGDSTAAEKPKIAPAQEPARVFAQRFTRLLATARAKKDCAEIEAVSSRSHARFRCPSPRTLAKSMESFELIAAEEFGTGAVVDYRSGEVRDGASITLFVGPDRNWGIGRFGVIAGRTVGTSDEATRDGYERAVDDYLAAARDRDCRAYAEAVFTGQASRSEVCESVRSGVGGLTKLLESNPAVRATYAGGNGTFGFFNLETEKPEPTNATISVMRVDEGGRDRYVILDRAASPTQAALRRLLRQYREQRKLGGSMAPSEEENTGKKAE